MNSKTTTFLDLSKSKQKIGRIKIQLWSSQYPKTCQNFRQLCTGQYLKNNLPTGYKDSILYEISDDGIKGGDYNNNNGTKGQSIYGHGFHEAGTQGGELENGVLWVVAMIRDQDGKSTSLFQIYPRWSKDKGQSLLPFGQVVEEQSIQTLKKIIQYSVSDQMKGKFPVIISQCGEM